MNKRKIPFIHQPDESAKEVFNSWKKWAGKTKY